jgi:hypothetical protein
MEITEETYIVYKIKQNSVSIKDFDNFEDAYTYLQKDKNQWDSGNITHEYKVSEEFYPFNNKNNPRPEEIDLLFDGHID